MPLRRTDDHDVSLEPPRLEPLTAAQEAEAAVLLAALFAAAASCRAERGPLTGSMDLVQDGIDDPIRQDLHPAREVGGEECFGLARLRHASCSWSRDGVRASASRAARIAAVA